MFLNIFPPLQNVKQAHKYYLQLSGMIFSPSFSAHLKDHDLKANLCFGILQIKPLCVEAQAPSIVLRHYRLSVKWQLPN